MNGSEQIELFHEFISSNLHSQLLEVSRKEEESLKVDFSELSKFNVDLSEALLNSPEDTIKAIELAVQKFDIPKKVNVRFFNLPESCLINISDIRSKHIGKFIKILGTIRTKTEVRPQVIGAKFECPSCGNVINVAQDDTTFQSPTKCSCGRKGKFKLIETKLIDAQKITLEESHEDLESGAQPKRMDVFLKEDLASPWTDKRRNPGTRVIVYGYVKEIPIILRSGAQSITFQLIVMGNYVEPTEEDFTVIKITPEEETTILELSKDPKIYEKLNESIAPSIYGHDRVKEALVLQMFGGVRKKRDDGVVTRGDTHILLIGDPGSGKCLHEDSKVVLSDGSIERIKNIEEDYSTEFTEDGFSLPNKDLNVVGFNGYCENQMQKATKIWKRFEVEKMLDIKTTFGSEIIVTKNHPFFKTSSGIVYGEEASQLKVGDYIATPRFIKTSSTIQTIDTIYNKSKANYKKTLQIPPFADKKFARFLGYVVGDGYVSYTKSSGVISLTNNEDELLTDFVNLAKRLFGLDCTVRTSRKGKTAKEAYCHSKELISFFENLDSNLLKGAAGKKIPQIINKSPNTILREFIKSYIDCDGHLNVIKDQIEVASKSKELIEDLKTNLLRFGIVSKIELIKRCASNGSKIKRDYYRLMISGEFAEIYCNEIGFNANKNIKKSKILMFNNKKRNTNVDIIPNIHSLLRTIKKGHNLFESDFGIPRTTFQHYVRGDRNPSRNSVQMITAHLRNKKIGSIWTDILERIQRSDIFWDKIMEIKEVDGEQYVYDFEIQETHNFVANSMMVHNSQLINRMSVVAPKSRFVSGKGVSGAGLTASVIKDDFTGGWALEAGALVLANKGYCMIDEMDKMNKEDRDAMHEALEQQSYHYDTEIMFADGTTQKIGEFVDEQMELYRGREIKGKDCEVLKPHYLPNILTTDFKEIWPVEIDRVSRHKAPEHFYKIKYRNGRSIVVTPEHPVFVVDDGEIVTLSADNIRVGMFSPAPKRINSQIVKNIFDSKNYSSMLESGLFFGLFCSEGHSYKSEKHRYSQIGITNTDSDINSLAKKVMTNVFSKAPYVQTVSAEKREGATLALVSTVVSSNKCYKMLEEIAPEIMCKAPLKRVPDIIKSGNLILKLGFLKGFFLGDGFVDDNRAGFCSSSQKMVHDLQQLLLCFNVYSYVHTEKRNTTEYYKVIISGSDGYEILNNLVPEIDKRKRKIVRILEKSNLKNNDRNVIPHSYIPTLISLLNELKLNDGYFYKIMKKKNNVHIETVEAYLYKIKETLDHTKLTLAKNISPKILRQTWKIEVKDIANMMRVSTSSIYNFEKGENQKKQDVLKAIQEIIKEKEKRFLTSYNKLRSLIDGEIRFTEIVGIEKIKNINQKWTYDVTVEPNHTFISQNLVLHNTVSISKANIQATLRCQTTVLAAANPKYGRFDPYGTIAEQIDMPPSLINRFDLIFPIKDLPNKERDSIMSKFILKLHQNAAQEKKEVAISTEMIRKYIAYAKQNCRPVLTDDAITEIQEFYVKMRNSGGNDDSIKSVPISARQLEGVIRLAEASAKVRLKKVVDVEDAKRAMNLVQFCLTEIATDKETGKIDIDRLSSGISASARGQIINIKEIINHLTEKIGRDIPIADVIMEASSKGISAEKVEESIEKLKRSGDIFEPRSGFIQKL